MNVEALDVFPVRVCVSTGETGINLQEYENMKHEKSFLTHRSGNFCNKCFVFTPMQLLWIYNTLVLCLTKLDFTTSTARCLYICLSCWVKLSRNMLSMTTGYARTLWECCCGAKSTTPRLVKAARHNIPESISIRG